MYDRHLANNMECDFCKKPFHKRESHRNKVNFCGLDCYNLYRKEFSKRGANHPRFRQMSVSCINCGKEFLSKRARIVSGTVKYCSKACEGEHKTTSKVIRICEVCDTSFVMNTHYFNHKAKGRFCSQKCMGKAMSGENSKWWNGGISNENQKIRNNPKYRKWRRNVFGRDNFTCRACGIRGGYLEAHHILRFSKHPESRTNVNNGITLCKKCHKKEHSRK